MNLSNLEHPRRTGSSFEEALQICRKNGLGFLHVLTFHSRKEHGGKFPNEAKKL